MVMPRAFSSGALSIWSNATNELSPPTVSASTLVIAAVSVVLPWSMWPIVPTLTWGLVLAYFFLAISCLYEPAVPVAGFLMSDPRFGDELVGKALGKLLIVMELHAVVSPALRHAAQVGGIAEHR